MQIQLNNSFSLKNKPLSTDALITTVCILILHLPLNALAANTSISTETSIQSNCAVRFDLNEFEGEITATYQGKNYSLAKEMPNSIIDINGFTVVGDVAQALTAPEPDRVGFVIIQNLNGEQRIVDVNYDADALSEQVSQCLRSYSGFAPSEPGTGSPIAPMPNPTQLQQQADELGIDIADYYACPCGEAFSAVQMDSPPWKINSLTLHAGASSCTLRTNEESDHEIIRADTSKRTKKNKCWAKVGLTTDHQQVTFRAKIVPPYTQEVLQACYNIISAKARQWLQSGHEINFVDDTNNEAKDRKSYRGSIENLLCTTAQ